MARREEERELRRQSILDAARRVIGRDGVESSTMGDIATEARLSRALLYVYFRDQDDLKWALVAEGLDQLHSFFREAAGAASTGLDALDRIGWAYIRLSREHPVEWELLAHKEVEELVEDDSPADSAAQSSELRDHRAICTATGGEIHELMASQVERGVVDGTVRDDIGDPLATALALWGMTHGLLQIACMKAVMLEEGYEITVQHYLDHGMGMLSRALKA